MPLRYSWRSNLRLSLVSVPVQAFNAVGDEEGESRGEIRLHQLHAKCHSRIRYKKVCPLHGEVPNDEIVSAYQTGEDQYVEIDDDELDQLRPESEKSVRIETFIAPDQIDLAYLSGQHYYLVPDGTAAVQPYAVLLQAMKDMDRHAIGQAKLFNRERLFLLRPIGALLGLSTLFYSHQLRNPQSFAERIEKVTTKKVELKLAETLIGASSQSRVDLTKFEDTYQERLHELITAKVEGRDVVAPPEEDSPPVINLVDALRASVEKRRAAITRSRKSSATSSRKTSSSRRATARHKRKVS